MSVRQILKTGAVALATIYLVENTMLGDFIKR